MCNYIRLAEFIYLTGKILFSKVNESIFIAFKSLLLKLKDVQVFKKGSNFCSSG